MTSPGSSPATARRPGPAVPSSPTASSTTWGGCDPAARRTGVPAMSAPGAVLHCFAYGEHLDALSGRSLGYRLLAPAEPEPWCGEVEALARRLQAAPYPEHWPATDLFCSVLLADGRRLVAVARYGLVDHTPDRRRGGLELIGAVAPAGLRVPAALAVYRWLQKRREESDE